MSYPLLILPLALLVSSGRSQPPEPASVTLELRLAEEAPGAGLTAMKVDASDDTLYVAADVLLDESHVRNVEVTNLGGHATVIEVAFTDAGARRFEAATAANVGKMCAMIVDGRLVSAPVIRDAIRGGRAVISGSFTEVEAQRIADGLAGR